jgi:hypothetical protein
MPNPIFRARWLAPALMLVLTGCGAQHAETRFAAHQAQVDPPALWRVEALDATGRPTAALQVCADRTMREGFARATAEIAGQPCLLMKDKIEQPGLFAVRCELNGQRFGLTVNRSGDLDREFEIAFAMKALDGTGAGASQVRRFKRIGRCPAGWGIGDQARLSEPRGVNALAGTWSGE